MSTDEKDIVNKLSPRKMILPVALGLAVAAFLLYLNLTDTRFEEVTGSQCGEYGWVDANEDGVVNSGDEEEFVKVENCAGQYRLRTYQDTLGDIDWTWTSTMWILMALLGMVVRDVAYMYRIRVLTDDELSWKQSFRVIMLWEFASALTPSVVGGSGIAMFILNREKINLGKSTAIVLVSALLDELFYITMVAIVLIAIGTSNLFPINLQKTIFGTTYGTQGLFWIGYGFICLLTTAIMIGVFFIPRTLKYLLLQIFRLPILRRWRYNVIQIGDDIITTSKELKGKPVIYWVKAFGATYVSWTARYLVVNFLILAFVSHESKIISGFMEHLLIYARQLVMWVIMLISPTPGSSGVAEFAFSGFFKEFIPLGLVGALALLWRLISYYPYLFIGAIILPRWLRATSKASADVKKKTA
ncbi:flippase-like domain-containing protein [Cryomorpha ignava]|uniref:Flippase-like domain-containing protein n=1 Tax=Cryomorpha ignava TaxID=101383 RepID=A0A7K3WQE0_9FLAO|nr:lysylphosphatidylglycerol synthase transmembrane domain-containing protein [Cryomorpha ignava]NEN23879.1 flippase-like domain-containing protein [Cryomorpha ignava]